MQPAKRTWPLGLAVFALVFLAILVPVGALVLAIFANFSIGGYGGSPEGAARALAAIIVGMVSGILAIVAGIAAFAGGRGAAVRVVAGFAIAVGLLTGGIHGLILASSLRTTATVTAPDPAPQAPSCGPNSHPVVFGGDSRYTACPADLAVADELLASAVPQLPVDDVTRASVDAVAFGISADVYDMTYAFDNGDIVVAWYPAPVTCAMALWRDGAWTTESAGMLADGGCIYAGN